MNRCEIHRDGAGFIDRFPESKAASSHIFMETPVRPPGMYGKGSVATMLATVVAIAMAVCGAASAQDFKISHQWRQDTDARDRATRVFVEEATKRDPHLRFRIFPGSTLIANPFAQLDAIQNGSLDMAVFPLTYGASKASELSIAIMPGTVSSLEHAQRLKGTRFHDRLQDVAAKLGFRIVTWWWTPGGFATKSRVIGGPDTVKGLSMRAADPTFESMLRAAGAAVINMPSTEIYSALQSGVLNGALTSAETFVSMRLYEQTQHATVGGAFTLWMLMQPLVMSTAAWDRLTPQQKKVFKAAADRSDEYFLGTQREANERMAAAFTTAGAKVRGLTKEEYVAWVDLAKKTAWVEFANSTAAGKELLDLLTQVE
ncbi:MAG: TRAP transporter substrate-binding protein DctP [Proteobacteria bacterium]|nr:TRAP transporter substrate-binding protein DctP [Pseudomonadota bacterium]